MSEHAQEVERRNGRRDGQGNRGQVVEIKGVVIDAVFTENLPEIYNALSIEMPGVGDAEAASGC